MSGWSIAGNRREPAGLVNLEKWELRKLMTGKLFKRPLKRGMKFLILAVGVLVGLYLIAYLVVLWFLSSSKGQAWIEQIVTSELGISARWEGASVSPLLEPSLRGVSIELKTEDGQPPQRITLEEVIVKWPLFGSREIRLRNIRSASEVATGVDGHIESTDVAWENVGGEGKRLSLQVREPVLTISAASGSGAAPAESEFSLNDLRQMLGTVNDLAMTTLGRLTVDDGRIALVSLGEDASLQDISISRVSETGPLQLKGRARGPGGSELTLELALEGTKATGASGRTSVSLSDLRWLPSLPNLIPREFLGPTVVNAHLPAKGPLRISVSQTESGGQADIGLSSLSPVSATGSLRMKDIALADASLGVSGRVTQIRGDLDLSGMKQGWVDIEAELDDFSYKKEDLQFSTSHISLAAHGNAHIEEGLQDGRLDLTVSPSQITMSGKKTDLPTVTLTGRGLSGTLDGAIKANQLTAQVGDLAQFTGALTAKTKPSLEANGTLNSKGISLDKLTQFLDTVPVSGSLDLESQFDIGQEATRLQSKATIAGLHIPQATTQMRRIDLDTKVTLTADGALTGTMDALADTLKYEDISLSELKVFARLVQPRSDAPLKLSDIQASCPLFSTTGEVELISDSQGAQALNYDLSVRFSDLSQTYQELQKITEKLKLDGIEFGGRATVRITGSWVRERDWKVSTSMNIENNYAMAGERELPVEWDGLNAIVEAEISGGAEQNVIGRVRAALSDFLALADIYEINASGRQYVFEGQGEYHPSDHSVSVKSATLRGPGGFTARGKARWSPAMYDLTAEADAVDLALVHKEMLKSVLVSGWPESASLAVGGSLRGELALRESAGRLDGEATIQVADGWAEWGLDRAEGLNANLSAELRHPAGGPLRLEPAEPMQISANRIRWGSDEVSGPAVHPRINDGNIEWNDTIHVPIPGGRVELGPVSISRPLSSDRVVRSSLRLQRVSAELNEDFLPSSSVMAAHLPEVTISRNTLAATGEMTLHIFDGRATVSGIRVIEFFSPYPVWAGDMIFESLNLARVCNWLDFGLMEGAISGSVQDLQLSIGDEIRPLSFELDVESDPGGGIISRQAIKMLVDLGQQASTRLLLDRAVYAYGRLGLHAKLEDDHFFLWGKFKQGDKYYFVEPPDPVTRVFAFFSLDFDKLNTVRIALNSPDRELSFKDVWDRLKAMSITEFEQPEVRISFFRRLNPFTSTPF